MKNREPFFMSCAKKHLYFLANLVKVNLVRIFNHFFIKKRLAMKKISLPLQLLGIIAFVLIFGASLPAFIVQ